MNELSCSIVTVLPWACASGGAIAAAAPPATAIFRKSRRDALLIGVLPLCFSRLSRLQGQCRDYRIAFDLAATSRRIGPLDRSCGPERPDNRGETDARQKRPDGPRAVARRRRGGAG